MLNEDGGKLLLFPHRFQILRVEDLLDKGKGWGADRGESQRLPKVDQSEERGGGVGSEVVGSLLQMEREEAVQGGREWSR